jgi:hypothetical protein
MSKKKRHRRAKAELPVVSPLSSAERRKVAGWQGHPTNLVKKGDGSKMTTNTIDPYVWFAKREAAAKELAGATIWCRDKKVKGTIPGGKPRHCACGGRPSATPHFGGGASSASR